MKIACLQFAPRLGCVGNNMRRADALLDEAGLKKGDAELLVLPELAFSGYNFPSLDSIEPYLEPTAAGPSTAWARRVAAKLGCVVVVGYPEASTADASAPTSQAASPPATTQTNDPPTSSAAVAAEADSEADVTPAGGLPVVPQTHPEFPYNFNASVAVAPDGTVLAHYRKAFLYYTDTRWAREGGAGFWAGALPLPVHRSADGGAADAGTSQVEVQTALGICMDLNPRNFTAAPGAYEFARHVLRAGAALAVVCMAWLSHELTPAALAERVGEPDAPTVAYWMERLRPLREESAAAVDGAGGARRSGDGGAAGDTRILVLANRCGTEGEVCYAGTSAVVGIGGGKTWIWDICGRGEERVCVVDTEEEPKYALRTRSSDGADEGDSDDSDGKAR